MGDEKTRWPDGVRWIAAAALVTCGLLALATACGGGGVDGAAGGGGGDAGDDGGDDGGVDGGSDAGVDSGADTDADSDTDADTDTGPWAEGCDPRICDDACFAGGKKYGVCVGALCECFGDRDIGGCDCRAAGARSTSSVGALLLDGLLP